MIKQIKYNIFSILLNSILATFSLVILSYVTYDIIFNSNYIGYLLILIILIVTGQFTLNSLRNTYRYALNLPAIELTELLLFDHQKM